MVESGQRRLASQAEGPAALVILLGIVTAACGGGGRHAAGSTLQVTLDGTDCTYSGPQEVSESDIGLRVDNQGEAVLTLEVFRLQEGKRPLRDRRG